MRGVTGKGIGIAGDSIKRAFCFDLPQVELIQDPAERHMMVKMAQRRGHKDKIFLVQDFGGGSQGGIMRTWLSHHFWGTRRRRKVLNISGGGHRASKKAGKRRLASTSHGKRPSMLSQLAVKGEGYVT